MGKNGERNTFNLQGSRVALVYDRVNKWGGAERVIVALRKIFPEAVLFTSVYDKKRALWAKKIPVVASFLQKIPYAAKHHEALAAFMPIAFESFNFDKFNLVVSLTSEAGKGIITKPATRHISIILTPTRYLWSGYKDYFSNIFFRALTYPVISYLRFWDKLAAWRPDVLIAISQTVRSRIKKYYGLESEIIYPPLMVRTSQLARGSSKDEERRAKTEKPGYFLVVSRLVPYKRVDLAVKAATKLSLPLKVIGIGNEFARLKKIAGPTVEFLGYISDTDLKYYYANCRALIFPGVEDFGLSMVEAQAFGRPVIAFRGGGAEEIIIDGKTGKFFDRQTVAALCDVLKNFRYKRYNSLDCKRNVRRFAFEQFKRKILSLTS